MKQRKFHIYDTSSSSDECNGHVKYLKEINSDIFVQSTNGNRRIQKCEVKIDKTTGKCTRTQRFHMKQNRSQRCLEYNNNNNDNIVQTSMGIALPIYSKFAFHRIIHFSVVAIILLCTVCSPANGQQQQQQQQQEELRQNMRNTGE